MEFATTHEAAHAITAMNGHPFDARHTFIVNLFTDIEKFANLDESFVEPRVQEYRPKVRCPHFSWRAWASTHVPMLGAFAGMACRPTRP